MRDGKKSACREFYAHPCQFEHKAQDVEWTEENGDENPECKFLGHCLLIGSFGVSYLASHDDFLQL